MNEIHDLLHLLKRSLRYSNSDIRNMKDHLLPNEGALLELSLHHKGLTDKQAADMLLGRPPTDQNFRRHRRRLRLRLLQEILKFDPPPHRYSNFQRVYYQCYQLFASFMTTKGLSYSDLSVSVAEQLIQKCRLYYFNDIRVEVARYLSSHYSSNKGDLEKAREYYEEAVKCNDLISLEIKADWCRSKVISKYLESKSHKPEVSEEALYYQNSLTAEADRDLESYKFYYNYYLLGNIGFIGKGDYENGLINARKAYMRFESMPFDHRSAKGVFLRHMGDCYLQLGHILEARQVIEKSMLTLNKGVFNWFTSVLLLMRIEIHQQNYESAHEIYLEISQHRNFENLREDIRNICILYGAYLEFLILIGQIPSEKPPSRFRINKFVNEAPNLDSDKRGMKIPLIVAQLLYNIYDRDYDAMERRIYALKDFCSRNLVRRSPNFRSNCFIKMLLQVPINNFNPIAVRRKTNKYKDRLSLVPLKISRQPSHVEIIPYEHLWEFVLQYLKVPKRKRQHAMETEKFVL